MNPDLAKKWDAATNTGDLSGETLHDLAQETRKSLGPEATGIYETLDAFGPCVLNTGNPPADLSFTSSCALLAADAARHLTLESAIGLNIILSRLAFLAPELVTSIFDLMSRSWIASAASEPPADISGFEEANVPPRAMPVELSDRIWEMVSHADRFDGDPEGFTANIAAMGASYHEDIFPALEQILSARSEIGPLAREAETSGHLPDIELTRLKGSPARSFGSVFYKLITDNNFNVEVLSSDDMGLDESPHPTLAFTTKRILQTHDVFHIVADYPITPFGEVAISGFQLAQMGQNYSAAFFAVTSRITLFRNPAAFSIFIQLALEGWRHGRETPNLLSVDWHRHWNKPVSQVRAELEISPFRTDVSITDQDLRPEIF